MTDAAKAQSKPQQQPAGQNGKAQNATFSYAKAAQTPSTAGSSPSLNGSAPAGENSAQGKENQNPSAPGSGSSTPAAPAWSAPGGVQMPARAGANPKASAAVQFGNFANAQTPQKPPSAGQPMSTPQASGGAAPPALQGKDMPQFGSITPGNGLVEQRQPTHSRSGSNASELRASTMSPRVDQNAPGMPQYAGQPGFNGGYPGQFDPSMRNGQQRHGMNQYPQNRAQMNVRAGPGGRPSPSGTPQQHHAQLSQGNMNSPMGSPANYGYMGMPPQMFQNYGGYPPQMQFQQGYQPQMQNQFYNAAGARMSHGGNQFQPGQPHQQGSYQNPNFANASQSMSRSGSMSTDRPSVGTPGPSSSATPATSYTPTPRKKGSAAIKIVRPDTKEEVVIPKRAPAPASTPSRPAAEQAQSKPVEAPKAATPKPESPAPTSASTPAPSEEKQPEGPDVIKAKQNAARQAVLDKIAANKAVEERKLAEEREAKEKVEREEREAREAEERKQAEEHRVKKEAEEAEAKKVAEAEAEAKVKRDAEEAEVKKAADEKAAEEKAAEDKASKEAAAREQADKLAPLDTQPDKTAEETTAEQPPKAETSQTASAKEAKDAEEAKSKVSAATTSLLTSRRISDLAKVSYPDGTKAPAPVANKGVQAGSIRYDKDFLMQFQSVFTSKPTSDWDDRLKEALGTADGKPGKGLGGRQSSKSGPSNPFGGAGGLPHFNTRPRNFEERLHQADMIRQQGLEPKTSANQPTFELGGKFRPNLPRGDSIPHSPRADSKRGKSGRAPSNKPPKWQEGGPTIAPEDVKPLEFSTNRWTMRKGAANEEPLPGGAESLSPELVQRKVKGLLNKLTLDNFDRISDQIVEIANQSKDEKDGRTLRQVIALTFLKATDEAHFSQMYAMFCRKMMECIDQSISDPDLLDKHGAPVTGGNVFRKYLLTRCQEDFETGWKSQLPPKPEGEPQSEEAAMLSDEYYIAAAAKRRGLGLVRFVGELFKLNMLNERIMHECVRKLLAEVETPEEEEVESLVKLLTTVGATLDSHERGAQRMDVYFERLELLTKADTLTSRIKFMVMDVMDLRKNKWVGKETNKGPKTIAEIHEDAAKAAAAAQRQSAHRGGGGGGGGRFDMGAGDVRGQFGGGSRRGDTRGANQPGPDGWQSVSREATRAGDLSRIGMRTQTKGQNFGPVSNLSGRTNSNQRSANPSHGGASGGVGAGASSLSREDSRSSQQPGNAFAVLEGKSEDPTEPDDEISPEDPPARPAKSLAKKETGGPVEEKDDGKPIPEPSSEGRPRLALLPKGSRLAPGQKSDGLTGIQRLEAAAAAAEAAKAAAGAGAPLSAAAEGETSLPQVDEDKAAEETAAEAASSKDAAESA